MKPWSSLKMQCASSHCADCGGNQEVIDEDGGG
jgi:hypothetical protein